jgi:CBS domain-containing protein
MILGARAAADLMTVNPVSIRESATVAEATAFLAARGISAAPVIDEAGRLVGVVSRTDVLQHQARGAVHLVGSPGHDGPPGRTDFRGAAARAEPTDRPSVGDAMTPVVFCVGPGTPAAMVVEKLLALRVRRLFVVDGHGILIGVISATDVLRRLRRWGAGGRD